MIARPWRKRLDGYVQVGPTPAKPVSPDYGDVDDGVCKGNIIDKMVRKALDVSGLPQGVLDSTVRVHGFACVLVAVK